MKEWFMSIDWNTVLVSFAGFGSAIVTAIIAAISSAKNTQRKQLVEVRSKTYSDYIRIAYATLFTEEYPRNMEAFFIADWQTRMVASKQTCQILFEIRRDIASLHGAKSKDVSQSNEVLHHVLPLMDTLAQSMLRDLKSRYR